MTDQLQPESRRRFRRAGERSIVLALCGIIVFLFIVNVVFGTYILTTTNDVKKTTKRVDNNTLTLKDGGYKNCIRGNGIRAEFQFRARLTPESVTKSIIKQFGLKPEIGEQTSLKALQFRLPIYNCEPLIVDSPAVPLDRDEQNKYVDDYAAGRQRIPGPQPVTTP